MKRDGASVILVSHDFRIVRGLCDEVLLVSDGRISLRLEGSEIGSAEDLERLVEMGVA